MYVCVLVAQSCPALCNPMDCSPPGFFVHGILQARILEWLPFPLPEDVPNPGIKPQSLALQADSLPFELQGSPSLPLTCSEHSCYPTAGQNHLMPSLFHIKCLVSHVTEYCTESENHNSSKCTGCSPLWLCSWPLPPPSITRDRTKSLGEEHSSHFMFLLNMDHFGTVVKLNNSKLNHHKPGPICIPWT